MGNVYIANKLFARPSFLEGVSRVIDLGATMQEYNTSKTESQADFEALRNDWCAVGHDLRSAIKEYGEQTAK